MSASAIPVFFSDTDANPDAYARSPRVYTFESGKDALRRIEMLRVNVRNAGALSVRARQDLTQQLGTPRATSNQPHADVVIGAQDVRCGQRPGESGSNFADKIPPRLHGEYTNRVALAGL